MELTEICIGGMHRSSSSLFSINRACSRLALTCLYLPIPSTRTLHWPLDLFARPYKSIIIPDHNFLGTLMNWQEVSFRQAESQSYSIHCSVCISVYGVGTYEYIPHPIYEHIYG